MNTVLNQTTGTRAIVVGGSIAGLLAARVLSDHVDEVIILEKDTLPDTPQPRKGVPQGGQLHSIHEKGADIIKELFPDLGWDFEHAGVTPCDLGNDMRWFLFGDWMSRIPLGVNVHWCERPKLEYEIRQRVLSLSNVQLLDDCKVTGFLSDTGQQQISGVTVDFPRAKNQSITADYTIDACGRGSRTPQFLEKIGYPAAPKTEVKIDLGYASGYFELPESVDPDWKALIISAKPGLSEKLGLIYRLPNRKIKVLMVGWFGDHPPTDHEAYLAFAKSLSQPDIYNYLRDAALVSPITAYKLPSNKWNRYEQMNQWPEGLFVLGDAVCSFNPSFGQGMSVAALHAVALGELLATSPAKVGRSFQKKAAKIVNNPWMITTGEDLRFPKAVGPRPFHLPIIQGYLANVLDVAHHNPTVAREFFDVMTFMKEPPALFNPRVLVPVAKQIAGNLFTGKPSPAKQESQPALQPEG